MQPLQSITKLICGMQISQYAPSISPLLGYYREWPYLYQQLDPLEDVGYVNRQYAQHADSIACIATHGETVVGVAMGQPLKRCHLAFPQEERRDDIFYWGELVVLPEFRRKGIAKQIYAKMGNAVIQSGKYRAICFASLDRPPDYRLNNLKTDRSLDNLWKRLGFEKRDDLRVEGRWVVLGDTEESVHPMYFWWKELD